MDNERWVAWKNMALVFVAGIIVFNALKLSEINVFTKENLWWTVKGIIFFFAFVFFCHGPLVWMGFLFSIEDGKGKIVYSKDRIWTLKITYYGRHLDKQNGVVEDEKNNFLKPLKWFKNYFFGSLHILGIPGIHNVDKEKYEWERLNPMTGKAEKAEGIKGEFPLREFIPSISFENLDVVGGQINVKIGPLIKITNPIKTATVARAWFPFFIDMIRGHIKECFSPLEFFRVMLNKENFGKTDGNGESLEAKAKDLSAEIMDYFESKEKEVEVDGKKNKMKLVDSLVDSIEYKYGIKIIKFYVIDPDPVGVNSIELLSSVSKPEKAKFDARETVIIAGGEADAFNKAREAMEKPGGKLLRELQALEKSNLVTLGGGKGLNIFVDTSKQKKGGGTSGNP